MINQADGDPASMIAVEADRGDCGFVLLGRRGLDGLPIGDASQRVASAVGPPVVMVDRILLDSRIVNSHAKVCCDRHW